MDLQSRRDPEQDDKGEGGSNPGEGRRPCVSRVSGDSGLSHILLSPTASHLRELPAQGEGVPRVSRCLHAGDETPICREDCCGTEEALH